CLYCIYTTAPALAAQLSGPQSGQTSQVLAQAQTGPGAMAQAPGGAPVLVGGAGPGDWSVRQFTVDSGDNLVATPVLPLTRPMSGGGVSISQGLVRHIEVQAAPFSTGPRYLLFNHELIVDSSQNPIINPRLNGGILPSPVPCTQGATCLRTVDGNGYGT